MAVAAVGAVGGHLPLAQRAAGGDRQAERVAGRFQVAGTGGAAQQAGHAHARAGGQVFADAGKSLRAGEHRRVVHRRSGHLHLHRRGRQAAGVVLRLHGEGVERAVGVGQRRPEGAAVGVDHVVAAGGPVGGRGGVRANAQRAAGDRLHHERVDLPAGVGLVGRLAQGRKANGLLQVFLARQRRDHGERGQRVGGYAAVGSRVAQGAVAERGAQGHGAVGQRAQAGLGQRGVDGGHAARDLHARERVVLVDQLADLGVGGLQRQAQGLARVGVGHAHKVQVLGHPSGQARGRGAGQRGRAVGVDGVCQQVAAGDRRGGITDRDRDASGAGCGGGEGGLGQRGVDRLGRAAQLHAGLQKVIVHQPAQRAVAGHQGELQGAAVDVAHREIVQRESVAQLGRAVAGAGGQALQQRRVVHRFHVDQHRARVQRRCGAVGQAQAQRHRAMGVGVGCKAHVGRGVEVGVDAVQRTAEHQLVGARAAHRHAGAIGGRECAGVHLQGQSQRLRVGQGVGVAHRDGRQVDRGGHVFRGREAVRHAREHRRVVAWRHQHGLHQRCAGRFGVARGEGHRAVAVAGCVTHVVKRDRAQQRLVGGEVGAAGDGQRVGARPGHRQAVWRRHGQAQPVAAERAAQRGHQRGERGVGGIHNQRVGRNRGGAAGGHVVAVFAPAVGHAGASAERGAAGGYGHHAGVRRQKEVRAHLTASQVGDHGFGGATGIGVGEGLGVHLHHAGRGPQCDGGVAAVGVARGDAQSVHRAGQRTFCVVAQHQ